jgi:hypothetical protein
LRGFLASTLQPTARRGGWLLDATRRLLASLNAPRPTSGQEIASTGFSDGTTNGDTPLAEPPRSAEAQPHKEARR